MKCLNQRWFWERLGAFLGNNFFNFWGILGAVWGCILIKKNVEIRLGIHLGSFARFLLLTMASGASICFLSLLGAFFLFFLVDFQKCKDFHNKINIFEGWRVSSGAQNRPQKLFYTRKVEGWSWKKGKIMYCRVSSVLGLFWVWLVCKKNLSFFCRKLPRERRGAVFGSFWVLPRAF